MKSLWSDSEAAQYTGPQYGLLGPRVYTSRLLGRDKSLVLHGGGNTSVKLREKDVFGVEHEVPMPAISAAPCAKQLISSWR